MSTTETMNGPLDRHVIMARKQFVHSVMLKYALEHRPYRNQRVEKDKQEDQLVAKQLAATIKSIEARMSGEATALKRKNDMSFLKVAEIAVARLAWTLEYRSGMDWREVTEEWVNGQLGKHEEQVAASAGVGRVW